MNADSFKIVKRYQYQVNALFAADELKKNNIISKIVQNNGYFELNVLNNDYIKSLHLIEGLDLDDSKVSENSDGYIDGLREWSEHRLNPPYWIVRSKVPHWLTDKRNFKYFGPFFLLAGLAMAYLKLKGILYFDFSELVQVIIILLIIIAGFRMTIIWIKYKTSS